MRKLFWLVYVFAILLSSFHLAFGQAIEYEFETLDISVPGHPEAVVWARDVNKSGWLLASTFWFDAQKQPVWGSLLGKLNGQGELTHVEMFFDCFGVALNDRRWVAGNSAAGPCVRRPNGSVITLAGVTQATAFGLSTDGRVAGQECVDDPSFVGCLHGFTWQQQEGYRRIDLTAAPGTKIQTRPLTSTKFGQVLIEYFISELNNNILEHGFCIWDNGACSAPFALSFEWRGGAYFFTTDMNDLAQIVFGFTPNDGTPATLKLYDDGIFYSIAGWPVHWLLTTLEGNSNGEDFVGSYGDSTELDNNGIPVRHDFIATPKPNKSVRK